MKTITYTIQKRITKKYGQYTAVIEEWNDGVQTFQQVRKVRKGTRQFGQSLLYGISPIEKGGCYDMTSVIKSVKSDVNMFYQK
jgi:hypothetical protein